MRLLTILIALTLAAATPTLAGPFNPAYLQSLGNTTYHELYSEILDRSFHVYVNVPDGQRGDTRTYPAVYVLDGGNLFPLVASYHDYLQFGEEAPAAIIVGISYGADDFASGNFRSTDYTAPSEERDYWGGAEAFQQFLEQELVPMVEARYPANANRRVIFGQSIGGQFVLYTAQTKPSLFWGHIASNPALHRNLDFFLDTDPGIATDSRVFVASATGDDPEFRTPALAWIEHWSAIDKKPWALRVEHLDGHSHMSAPPASYRAGMRWLFGDGGPDFGTAADPVTEYANGNWYTDAGFVSKPMYEQSGRLVDLADSPVARTVDLDGAYVVPAFAEGHHHMVLCEPERLQSFIKAGILYAGILNARVSSRECQARYHGPDSVEVANALAGITARDAHPSQIGRYFLDEADIDGEWVHYVDSAAELDSMWPRIQSSRPDILKVFLSYSEEFEMLRADPDIAPWYRGVDPSLAGPIVERAHSAGLRVVAHVMSAHDFDVAVKAGVDIIGHMPGFAPGPAFTENESHPWLLDLVNQPARYRISSEMARRAARNGVSVITTVATDKPPSDSIVHNFAILREAGVRLLVGSDQGEGTSINEAIYLASHGLMTPAEILESLVVDTPKTLFPERMIGALAAGNEATFVILPDNPLERFETIEQVEMVVKQGKTLFED